MKSFINWLFKTGNGRLQCIYWIVFFIIFWTQGFKAVRFSILEGEVINAKIMYFGAIICTAGLALLTANNYNRRAK